MDYCFCLRPEYIHSSNIFYFNISQTVVLSGFINKRNWSKTYRHCIGNPEKFDTICFVFILFYKSNNPDFLSVYQRNTQLGTLGKHALEKLLITSKSVVRCLMTFHENGEKN